MKGKAWFVYIIKTQRGLLYTGITTDLERRYHEHVSGKGGAKFFRGDPPQKMIWTKKVQNRSEASKEEARIKQMTRAQKIALIQSSRS